VLLPLQDMNLADRPGRRPFRRPAVGGQGAHPRRYARSVYLELHHETGKMPDLVCVLPRGSRRAAGSTLATPSFTLLVNRRCAHRLHLQSPPGRQARSHRAAGEGSFHPLPTHAHGAGAGRRQASIRARRRSRSITVQIEVELTELGVLRLALVNEERHKRWRLISTLRKPLAAEEPAAEGQDGESRRQAGGRFRGGERIGLFYGKKQSSRKGQRQATDEGSGAHPRPGAKPLEHRPAACPVAGAVSGHHAPRPPPWRTENTWLYLAGSCCGRATAANSTLGG